MQINRYKVGDIICFQVRRTRISERMRKLQELVPNMDKVCITLHACMCNFPSIVSHLSLKTDQDIYVTFW